MKKSHIHKFHKCKLNLKIFKLICELRFNTDLVLIKSSELLINASKTVFLYKLVVYPKSLVKKFPNISYCLSGFKRKKTGKKVLM